MAGNIFWKFLLTLSIVAWCLISVTPLQDRPFEEYITAQVTAESERFEEILEQARSRVAASRESAEGGHKTLFIALREIGAEEGIDFIRFFPEINLKDVPNQNKRNNILLKHLLKSANSPLRLGLDLKGGVGVTMKVDEAGTEALSAYQKSEQLTDAIRIMGDRLDGSGVAEPIIRPKGEDAIEIQMPGLSTKENPEVLASIKKPARLEFRALHPSKYPDSTPADQHPSPYEYEVLTLEQEDSRSGEVSESRLFVKRVPEATGDIVAQAYPFQNQSGGFEIHLEMTGEGAATLRSVTERMVGDPLAIVLDGKLYSAPTIQSVLSKSAQISGNFSQREAIDLANVLNNPLALPLRVDEMYEVGPSMAEEAQQSSIKAMQVGALLVICFMLIYYFAGGLVAILSALINVVIVLGVLASLGATLTLPGVAALVLTLGMGVDANILIFERLREELSAGKSIKHALSGAFSKVTSTIVDANVTTLITASILIWLGTGPVRGFGITLAIGICASIFCALVVTRFMADFLVHRLNLSKLLGLSLLGQVKFDFFKYRRPAFIASWLLVGAGAFSIFMHHDNIMGIDFTGGDEMTIAYGERIETGALTEAAASLGLGEVNPVYQTLLGEEREILKIQTRFDQSRDVLAGLQEAFPQASLQEVGINQIGASVSSDIQWNALLSVLFALLGILLYVAFRFEVGYGIGAVIATIHDVLMTVGIFVICGALGIFVSGQFTAPMLAAILMIVGYSINDTIVVFDRIREELELNPGTDLRRIINLAISRVFSRSLLTSLTTLLAATSLYVFGAGVINDFAFVFIIGILTGTFSSIFIASPVFFWWHKGDRRHVEERELTPKRYDWQSNKSE